MRRLLILLTVLAAPAWGREIEDMAGRVVSVPDHADRVACLEVLCYPKMLMLGAADRVVLMTDNAAPWLVATNPAAAAIPRVGAEVNMEEVLARGAQLAFFRYAPERTRAKLAELGVPALLSQPLSHARPDGQGFADEAKAMVRLFGKALGGEAERRAEEWCAYFDERVRFVAGRVAKVPPARRTRLYYVRGPQALSTQGRGSYTYGAGLLAGADMVVGRASLADKGGVSMEDMLGWDPEVILVGRQYPLELVLDDPRWKDVAAVRSGRVHSTPEGVFYWDGGPENVLLMQFMAKLLYPDLFRDFDLAAEVKAYYARFYRVTLSDGDVSQLLQGRSPDGSRRNPMNN
ncbi:ABC transporter substrate-binding protein [Magnetospirillum aberrantis]|uniref:ABC transporter substrate-binding protein n=1 Tax=Magnetospirillum aberrantis SpK TaxID=908842 RepID=A0A7C9QTX2_9PROT|nr:ABC transporter substrate-binding protein [Magnetospirillum aberrantis]NFV79256.1 ABC transporter substrate-binding protein [Magnetospirillum aberrantis SpK]